MKPISNVNGQWRYLYCAVDEQGQTVDFLSSKKRDKAAAVRLFKKATGNNEAPEKITLDGSLAPHQAVAELKAEGALPARPLVRSNKYLNNLIERDHRKVKQRCYPMLGFKTFGNAQVTLSGIGSVANKPGARSSLLVGWPNSIITGGRSDQIQSVQMATLRVRNHSSLRPLVFTLRPQLSRSRRNDE